MILLLLALTSHAGIVVEPAPQPGRETMITVTDEAGEPAIGTYVHARRSPGLSSQTEWTIGTTDARGRVPWTPSSGGLVQLNAGGQHEQLVPVPYPSPPLEAAVPTALVATAGLVALVVGILPPRRRRQNG